MPLNVNVDVEFSDPGLNGVVYDGVSSLEARSVTLHGEVTDLGEATKALCYFEYINADAGETWANDVKQVPAVPIEVTTDSLTGGTDTAGEFKYTLTGLSPATLYKFRAVAEGQ